MNMNLDPCCLLDILPCATVDTKMKKIQSLASRSSLTCQEDDKGIKITVSKLQCDKHHTRSTKQVWEFCARADPVQGCPTF